MSIPSAPTGVGSVTRHSTLAPISRRARNLGVALLAASHGITTLRVLLPQALLPVLLPVWASVRARPVPFVHASSSRRRLVQPFIGHAADRAHGGRWMSWSGVLLCGLSARPGLVSASPMLALLMFLNRHRRTALWHPVSAGLVSESAPPNRRGLWVSAYRRGQFGLGLGPLMVGLVVSQLGLGGTWLMALPGNRLQRAGVEVCARPSRLLPCTQDSLWTILKWHRRMLGGLISVVTTRSWAVTAFQTFLPLYAAGLGANALEAAQTLTVYLVAGAMGGLVGGSIADRLGRDRVIIGSMLLSAPFSLALAFQNEVGPIFGIRAALSGFLLNGSFVVLTVRGQESVPGSVSMMSGMMLGLTIGLGALIVTPMAAIAERTGLAPMIVFSAILAPIGAGLMLLVPKSPSQAAG